MYKLSKALYGLKQAPRAWYERLSKFLLDNGFTRGKVDTTLFIKLSDNNMLIVQIYVDDIIFGSTNENLCKEFANIMHAEFEMSMMGELNFFLGLQIKQTEEVIFINQAKYIRDLLKKFGTNLTKSTPTPMSTSLKLDKDEKGQSVDIKKYRGMIGSLLYLTASRPDIMYSVCVCARYQSNPKESHLIAVKRILNIYWEHKILDYGILNRIFLIYLDILTLTLQVASWIEKVLVAPVKLLEIVLFLGLAKSNTQWLYPPRKLNMWLLEVVVLKFFGLCTNLKILELKLIIHLYYVIILAPSI